MPVRRWTTTSRCSPRARSSPPAGVDVQAALPSTAAIPVTVVEGWSFDAARATETLRDQLRVSSLDGFGLAGRPGAVAAAGALVRYLRDTQKADLAHVRTLRLRESAGRLLVDPTTVRHLELVESSHGGRAGSLLDEIDRTVTPMGGRLMRAWLLAPLVTLEPIRDRLDAVEELAFRAVDRGKVRETLKTVLDLERLMSRVALATASPRDLVGLRQSLAAVPRLRLLLAECRAPLLASLVAQLDDLADVRTAIEARDRRRAAGAGPRRRRDPRRRRRRARRAAADQPIRQAGHRRARGQRARPHRHPVAEGALQPGLRLLHRDLEGQPAPRPRRLHPQADDRRRRTLHHPGAEGLRGEGAGRRRAGRRARARAVRSAAGGGRRRGAAGARHRPRRWPALDVLAGLAETAAVRNYTKPHVHDGDELVATDVRHPVVERLAGGTFVPNDVGLDGGARQLVVLTGPNMGGKSTYLRQVALLSLLAQTGSFVPARDAKLGLVDRIYARVGASDNISRGQSTFMVEMQETAHILSGATSRSLVVLDEVGRGTATFDGLSIAWAVAEHLATSPRARPKTLFATHYHELTDLADSVPGVINAHVAVQEWKDDIVFLHKILPGRSDRSYGIHVARLAGLPPSVVSRARDILRALEQDELSRGGRPALSGEPAPIPQQQLGLFQAPVDDALRARLRELDIDRTTPLDALRLLAELKRDADA